MTNTIEKVISEVTSKPTKFFKDLDLDEDVIELLYDIQCANEVVDAAYFVSKWDVKAVEALRQELVMRQSPLWKALL
jgi:hypothetical protein